MVGQIFSDLEYFLSLLECPSPSRLNNSFRAEQEGGIFPEIVQLP